MSESLYQRFVARLRAEAPELVLPILKPSLEVHVEKRHRFVVDGDSLRGRIARLIVDGFFSTKRTVAQIGAELLKRQGIAPSRTDLDDEMKTLVQYGFFTRDKNWFRVVADMAVDVVEDEGSRSGAKRRR